MGCPYPTKYPSAKGRALRLRSFVAARRVEFTDNCAETEATVAPIADKNVVEVANNAGNWNCKSEVEHVPVPEQKAEALAVMYAESSLVVDVLAEMEAL